MKSPVQWVNDSLQRKLMFSYILVIVIPLFLMSFILYQRALHVVTEQTEKYNDKMLQLMNEKIDKLVTQIDRISYFVYLDDVQKLLNDIPQDPVVNASWQIDLKFKLNSWIGFLGFNGGIRSVTLLDQTGVYFNSENALIQSGFSAERSRWYQEALQSDGAKVLLGPKELGEYMVYPNYREGSLNYAIARKVYNLQGNDSLGVLVMGIELYDMNEIMSELNLDSHTGLMIVDKSKEIVYSRGIAHPDQQLSRLISGDTPGKSTIVKDDDHDTLVNVFTSASTGWDYITLTNVEMLAKDAKQLSSFLLWIGVFACLLAIVISFIFSKRIVIPLKRLQNTMRNIEKNDFQSNIAVAGRDEVGQLTISFNRMVSRIRELIHTVYRSEIQEKEAHIMALQSQINPHFLYNTLGTVNAMAMMSDNEEISKMVVALGDMFKYAMKQNGRLASIREEMEHLDNYMTIQRSRYGERIQFVIDIPVALMEFSTIRLVLQPLVENAIRHGLDPLPDGGTVWIRGQLDHDTIRMDIQDNGLGIEAEKLKAIQTRLLSGVKDGTYRSGDSIGLFNVNARLKFYFGGAYGVDVSGGYGEGTTVTLLFPAKRHTRTLADG
ncbi:cache domain-containing sensor histidine kinase [Paenibacillus thalictri]|uniref:histidine kinase n=1 Tax=Paenibacillus thalictri TaxID=2527873 RepID=A0A4Q9DR82_9BACL|nr:sensor histidine kinase [Paenibacillus thalictri]TBL79147.1 sensor histidine kinase [Paenibacillus thalictri]